MEWGTDVALSLGDQDTVRLLAEIFTATKFITPLEFTEAHKNTLWGALFEATTNQDYSEMFNHMTHMQFFSASALDFKLSQPAVMQPCVYNFKVVKGIGYFAVYFALSTLLGRACEYHGFRYNAAKQLWATQVDLNGSRSFEEAQGRLAATLVPLMEHLTAFCHVMIHRDNFTRNFNARYFEISGR